MSAGFSGTFQFKRRGGAAYGEPIFDLLTYSQELTGRSLTLALSVDENGVTVTDEKTLSSSRPCTDGAGSAPNQPHPFCCPP